ncbi:MAG: cytochrome c oxidase subunit II [Chloroflexota bacterium]|nr:cytochrome c oxidase subunit II [Chloroflexota bacterium]
MISPRQRRAPEFRQAAIIWAIVSAVLIVVALAFGPKLPGLIPNASERATDYVLTMKFLTILSCPILAMVIVFALYALFYWRSPHEPDHDGPYLVASKSIQIAWVGVSALLVIALYVWGLIFLGRADAAPAPNTHVLNVDVTGEQWNWNFTYPQYGNAQSGYLEVPVNRPILFTISSIDVVHSFSVPAWALKEDAVPGQFTYIRVTPNKQGSYSLACYELCGMFHSYMQSHADVVPASTFATWVRKQPTGFPWGTGGAGYPHSYNDQQAVPEKD